MKIEIQNDNLKILENLSEIANQKPNALTVFKTEEKQQSDIFDITKEILFKMLKQMSSSKNIIYLSDNEELYKNFNTDSGNKIIFYPTKPNEMLINEHQNTTQLFDKISFDYQNSIIVIDNINRYISQPFIEDNKKDILRKNKMFNAIVENNNLTSNSYIVIDDNTINHYYDGAKNISIKLEQYDKTVSKVAFKSDINETVSFGIINQDENILDNKDTEYLLSSQDDNFSTLEKAPSINVPAIENEIKQRVLKYGDNLPITIKQNGVSSKTLTKANLLLTVIKSNYEIPILYISPFEKLSDIKHGLLRLNHLQEAKVDKKAIKRTRFYTIEKLSNEEQLGQKDIINNIIKREFKEFSKSIKNKPFIAIIDLYDKESYNFSFDYNLVKILAKAYSSFTMVGMYDKNTRYIDTTSIEGIKQGVDRVLLSV